MNREQPEQSESFGAWLANRPQMQKDLASIFEAGLIDGTYDDLVPKITNLEDFTSIQNLVARYTEEQKAKNRAGAQATAREINAIFDRNFQ